MKHYFVKHPNNLVNEYRIIYTENDAQDRRALREGFSRIPREEAERLCREERYRKEFDPYASGYASTEILPVWYPSDWDWHDDPQMKKDGFLIIRK